MIWNIQTASLATQHGATEFTANQGFVALWRKHFVIVVFGVRRASLIECRDINFVLGAGQWYWIASSLLTAKEMQMRLLIHLIWLPNE